MNSIYDLTIQELVQWFLDHDQKTYRANQVWKWLYRKLATDFAEMTNLSKDLINKLKENFVINPLRKVLVQESNDGTKKILFETSDHLLIETVLMPQKYGLSLCVTTQIGCNMGCSFCASGLLKKQRDLTSGEIVAQVVNIQRILNESDQRVSNVVVMGIGEPFDNYNQVLRFLRIINSDQGLAIGSRHLSVSTSGLSKQIRQFAKEDFQVNLAISLHASNNDLRSQIMKINRSIPIEKLFAALDYYIEQTNRRVTFEYIMLDGINDQIFHAKELAELLQKRRKLAYVNLIPYNPVEEHDQYQRSNLQDVLRFYDVLKKNGINCVIRQEYGTDIAAACGQLRAKHLQK